ncbi:pirin family protein [Hyphomonas sp.]|uniref:pirin family protein n=1 Tax=Hyphomonas sp. TaxID=87 RepID=UPI00391891F1
MIDLIIDKRTRDLGGGFEVGRVLPFAKRRMVGPFIFFDQMGPVEFAPGIPRELDVRPHPHIGLSTVTYLYSGAMTHRDSLGFRQEIKPGAVNWMTAGKGITHSERLEHARMHGALMHGIQAWVALPKEDEEIAPGFWHHPAESLPAWTEQGLRGRMIAGAAEGMDAGVAVRSPMFYMHWDMDKGASRYAPNDHTERAVYVASGTADVGGTRINAGQMAILTPGQDAKITAEEAATVMLLGGEPIGERFIFWNFVSSSKDRLEQAKSDWKNGRMKLPDGDDQEFTPLPEG